MTLTRYIVFLGSLFTVASVHPVSIIPPSEIELIGWQVWNNESKRNLKNLIVWNNGEEGLSVGIAHFTWYPPHTSRNSPGTFPELVEFLEKRGHPLPAILGPLRNKKSFYAPWKTRQEFLQQKSSLKMQALRLYLLSTINLQMQFIIERVNKALSILITLACSPLEKGHLTKQFNLLKTTRPGRYALVDYINLAGEGGLYKILMLMKGNNAQEAIKEFVTVAKGYWSRHVLRADKRHQAKWLAGWLNRLDTYLVAFG